MQFNDLRLTEPLMRAVRTEGYTTPTPIQQKAIPHVLEGRDLIGCAQTGTGKTAAFALPMLQRLHGAAGVSGRYRPVRALVLAPTRELAR
jgi:ATP-dependent RNA helicase RhlE